VVRGINRQGKKEKRKQLEKEAGLRGNPRTPCHDPPSVSLRWQWHIAIIPARNLPSGGRPINDGLLDAFHHNAWATRQLLVRCRELTPTQRQATMIGVYGNPVATLWHIIASEVGYYFRLTDQQPNWDRTATEPPSVDELMTRAEEMAARWEAFLTVPFDAERVLMYQWKDGTRKDVPAGVVLAQVLHHGNEHRGQINTVFTASGVGPLALGLWDFAEDTNRATPSA